MKNLDAVQVYTISCVDGNACKITISHPLITSPTPNVKLKGSPPTLKLNRNKLYNKLKKKEKDETVIITLPGIKDGAVLKRSGVVRS